MKSRCSRSLTISNAVPLVCDPTGGFCFTVSSSGSNPRLKQKKRDEVVDELRIQDGGRVASIATAAEFNVWAKKVENNVSGVVPNVRGALSFAVESQDVVTAAAVGLGVPEVDARTSAVTDGQLYIVRSVLTDG